MQEHTGGYPYINLQDVNGAHNHSRGAITTRRSPSDLTPEALLGFEKGSPPSGLPFAECMHTICVLRHRPTDFWEETAWRVQLPRKVHSQACQRVQLPKKVHSRREMMSKMLAAHVETFVWRIKSPVKGKVLPLQILLLNGGNESRTQAIALRVQALAQIHNSMFEAPALQRGQPRDVCRGVRGDTEHTGYIRKI
ncbi:hypothetical protein B0H11DRAFT_1902534 [Mycena galericulata]|nr:hypothetical protein B0H11DRAFT_1902534 [Mycena galericulata]